MPPIDEPSSFAPPSAGSEGRRTKAKPETTTEPQPGAALLSFTVDSAAGRLVTVERVDASGARRELSSEEQALILQNTTGGLERLVERAFEAGIDCVLGADDADEEPAESQEDAQLRRLLLRSLIERSAVKELVEREALSRVIVGALLEQAAARAAAEGNPAH